jgi:DNA mismatch endonuclease (patch repair protein)
MNMADVLTKTQRSYNMSMIKGKNTKPEQLLKLLLKKHGLKGFRLHYEITGKPDIVFLKNKIAVFIDGCFWHKCHLHFTKPTSNRAFWLKKIDSNVRRDKIVNTELKYKSWKIIRIWEHELKNQKIIKKKVIDKIKKWLKK